MDETIVAVATPAGRGGIGVVRLSGALAREIASPVLRLPAPMEAGRARFARVLDTADGAVLDEAVVTYFAAPNSYTGEDVVEISAHGAPVLMDYLLRACMAGGARLAEPGEFTQRAFLAGRLDLMEAEAVGDLIHAQTLQQARVAAAQLGGSLGRAVAPVKQRLLELIAALEAGVDFAEDDVDIVPAADLVARLGMLRIEVAALAASYSYGRLVREGFTLAIAGRPNAGKSSLFNRLLKRERAIVTALPGTTRDPVAERFSLGGIPVELVDTAGLRDDPEGEAERIGMERSRMAMAEADLVLEVVDASSLGQDAVFGDSLRVWNKVDLLPAGACLPEGVLGTSALTGEGVEALEAAIVARLAGDPAGADSALVTNARQHGALVEAEDALTRAGQAAAAGIPQDVLLVDLYAGLEALDRLTGATGSEAVLGLIFSTFCIGK